MQDTQSVIKKGLCAKCFAPIFQWVGC